MIIASCAVALVAVVLALLLTLYRLFRGPDIVDRVLALDTLAINLIALIVLAGGNTAIYHVTIDRRREEWSDAAVPPLGARAAGLISSRGADASRLTR